jgi:hypothetical protein
MNTRRGRRTVATMGVLVGILLETGACGTTTVSPTTPTSPSPGATEARATAPPSPAPVPSASAGPASTPAASPPPPSPSPTLPAAYREGAAYAPTIDPAAFVAVVDNPYLPFVAGMRWVYQGGGERDVVEVLPETKVILGVTVTVVHDRVFSQGELTEDTFDWYAQDRAGNVWYFGERTEERSGGKVTSRAGSWQAGVNGAQPGIVMPGDPRVGDAYRQEYLAGEAEDAARVVRIGGSVTVRAGTYADVVVTEEWTRLEPDILERKTYAAGVGDVLERLVKGGKERVELVSFRGP